MKVKFCFFLLVLIALFSSVHCARLKKSPLRTSTISIRSKSTNLNSNFEPSLNSIMTQSKVIADGKPREQYEKMPATKVLIEKIVGVWAVLQVLSVLGNAVKRLYPIAIQPVVQRDMSQFHWILYGLSIVIMAYSEGYKGFQLKFSPMVIERAFSIMKEPSILKVLFAGPYSMGLFGADKKRLMVSWILTVSVFALVVVVKKLPYPYRSIVDAGVVVGLSYGSLSILFLMLKALLVGKVVTKDT